MILEIFYYFFFLASLLLPGYAFVKRLNIFKNNFGLAFCASIMLSLCLYGLLAIFSYIFDVSPNITGGASWLFLALGLTEFIRRHYYKELSGLRLPFFCVFALSSLAVAFVGLTFSQKYTYLPDYKALPNTNYKVLNVKILNLLQTGANDNYIPYRQAQFVTDRLDPAREDFIKEWGVTFFGRTALMGAVTANFFNMLHEHPPTAILWQANAHDPHQTYLQFQILAAVLNSLFIFPAYLLLVRLFGIKNAVLSCLFFVTNSFFLDNTVFTWPKSFVAFFILLAWLFLIGQKTRYLMWASLASGLAYLTHDLSILYIAATTLLITIKWGYYAAAKYISLPIMLALPWIYATSFYYKLPGSFIDYPISTKGIPSTGEGKQLFTQFLHTPAWVILRIRLENILYLLAPSQLFAAGQGVVMKLYSVSLYSVPGSVGLGLMLPSYVAFLKVKMPSLILLILAPIILGALYVGWPHGLGAIHFGQAVAVLLTGLTITYLRKFSKKVMTGAFGICFIQLVYFMLDCYRFTVSPWFSSLRDLVLLIYICLLLIVYWLMFLRALRSKHFDIPSRGS